MESMCINHHKLSGFVEGLEGTVLRELLFISTSRLVRSSFLHWDGHIIEILCRDVLLCNVSSVNESFEDSEIIGAKIGIVQQNGSQLLRNLGYLWHTERTSDQDFDYPLLHLELYGDTTVAIVCREVIANS